MWLGEYSSLRSLTPGARDAEPYQINTSIPFPGKTVGSIDQSRDGTLWVGAFEGSPGAIDGGLYSFDPQTESLEPVLIDADGPDMDIGPIIDIYEDSNGVFWLGTLYTDFFRFDRRTGSLTQYEHNPNNPNSLSHNDRTIIHGSESEPGILWIDTERGLNRFDTDKGHFRHFMLKEIYEQPEVIKKTLEGRFGRTGVLLPSFGVGVPDMFRQLESITLVACGISYHTCLVAKQWIEHFLEIPAIVEIVSE